MLQKKKQNLEFMVCPFCNEGKRGKAKPLYKERKYEFSCGSSYKTWYLDRFYYYDWHIECRKSHH